MTWPVAVGDSPRLLLVTDDPERSSTVEAELEAVGRVARTDPSELKERAMGEHGADCLVLDRRSEVEPSWSSLLAASALAVVVLVEPREDDEGAAIPEWVERHGFETSPRDPRVVRVVVDEALAGLRPPGWAVLDSVADSVAVVDARGRILHTNASWHSFGYENGGDGQSMRGVDYLVVADKAQDEHASLASAAIRRVLRRESEQEQVEYPCHAPNRRRWFRMTVTRLDEPPGAAVITHADVSNYRQQVSVLERVLRHNLRNELNVITGYAEELERRATTPQDAALAATVEDAARDVLKLCDRVRTARETMADGIEPGDIVPLLANAVADARENHPEAVVEADLPATLPSRGCGVVAVAVAELLENALRHADTPTSRVRVRAAAEAGDVVVSVVDDGPGIPTPERRTLMGLSEDRPTSHGEGLGAWLVQTLIETVGGTVTVTEREEGGTDVTVRVAAAVRPGGSGTE